MLTCCSAGSSGVGAVQQIHVTYVNPTEVIISWATGNGAEAATPIQVRSCTRRVQ